jgi:hypothetical protein
VEADLWDHAGGRKGKKTEAAQKFRRRGRQGRTGPWRPLDALNVLGCWLARARWLVLARDRAGLGVRGQSGWLALAKSWCWLAALRLAAAFLSGRGGHVFLTEYLE